MCFKRRIFQRINQGIGICSVEEVFIEVYLEDESKRPLQDRQGRACLSG